MRIVNYDGNIFEYAKRDMLNSSIKSAAVVITTNGMTTKTGKAVMGAGIAKYARDGLCAHNLELIHHLTRKWYPENMSIDMLLGDMLNKEGNQAFYLGQWADSKVEGVFDILTMPTKDDWKDDSKISLIMKSCNELVGLAEFNDIRTIYLPVPGCNSGHLDERDVIPVIGKILDDRFVLVKSNYRARKFLGF